MTNQSYMIAGHVFRLSFPKDTFGKNNLANYVPFGVADSAGECLFHMSVTDTLSTDETYTQIGQFDDDIASIAILKSEAENFRFRIAYPRSDVYCTMDVDACFREAKVQLPSEEQYCFFCLNNCLMLLYAFATANLDTLMMHASVVKNNGEGFIFLGKSGTGKSTHSRLWIEHVKGSELLNDDNPVLRIIDGKARVFGSPWSGKTPCYKNDSVPLKGIVKLRQAPGNKIKELSLLQAYAAVLPACSCMRWEEDMMAGVHSTVAKLASTVACYQLDCLPNKAAAELCAATTREKK